MSEEKILSFDIMELIKMLPHRYPFLLVDKVTECVPGKWAKAYKNVTFNEPFFQGHFPGNPIMPGVLQLEALAQAAAPCLMSMPENQGKLPLFVGIDKVKFKTMVRPGDRLDMEGHVLKLKGPLAKCYAKASVDGKLACEAELSVLLK